MSRQRLDWDALRAEWVRAADGASAVASAQRQMARARRASLIGQAIEGVVAGVAIAFVALALHHAANALHAALGIVVGGAIGAVWVWRRDLARQEQRSIEASGIDHLRLMRGVHSGQLRMAQFVEAVIVLDLVFLIPWWITGSRVHSRRLTDIGSFETVWIPLVGMAILFGWSLRVAFRARRSLLVTERAQVDRVGLGSGI